MTAEKIGRGQIGEAFTKVIDPELLAEAEKWLNEKEIKDRGGYRSDENKDIYWMDIRQLIEFQKADSTIPADPPEDKPFWSWFTSFREDEGLLPKNRRVSWRDQVKQYAWEKPKNYMTKWWSDSGYQGSYGSAGSEETRNLAVALGAVTTTVSVINNTGKRYRVELAADDNAFAQKNFTNFDESRVVVSPQALLDKTLTQDDKIEITTGYGLHEASHIEYTESLIDALRKPSEITPLTMSQRLFNILEDAKIEKKTGERFPGFVSYFEKMLAYLWKKSSGNVPREFGPDLNDKMNAILSILRWPTEFEPIARADTRLSEEFDWFRDWLERYLSDAITPRQALVEAFAHLREDPETEKQMQELGDLEQQNGAGGTGTMTDEQFKKFMKDLGEALKSGKEIEVCPSPANGQTERIKLKPEQAKEVRDLIQQELRVDDPIVKMAQQWGGLGGPKIVSLKPELTQQVRSAYRRPSNLVGKMKGAFFFRKAAPMWSERLLKNGAIDEEELWRFGAHDDRIFERRVTADVPETQITLLIDMSGSMSGERIATAYEMGNVMLACLKDMKGVRVRMRGHTTGSEASGGECTIFRLWEPGDPMERLGLIDTLPHGWNYDGFAVGWCAEEMLADQRPREDAVMFVLSDGKPNARGFPYSGPPAMDHVRRVVDHYAKLGVTIVQIAIDPEMRKQDQERMYRNWIPFETREKLPAQLTKSLIKLFGGG